MADTVADLSGEEREKRIAELKAKMQSAAKKARPEPSSEPKRAAAQPAAAVPPAAQSAAAVQPAAQPAAERAVVQKTAGQAAAVRSNGAASNGGTAGLAQPVAATVAAFVEESPEEKAHKEMSRREFLTYGWGGVLGLVTLQSGVGLFQFMMPRFKAGEFGGVFFIGPETTLPDTAASPQPVTGGKFWLVNTEEEGPVALYMVCTHLGCLYKWEQANNRFECPCHGSKFTREGYFIEGPAPRSLDKFAISIENGEVAVNTGKRVPGSPAGDSPARVIPA
ncbi:MAG: ubiquinol-cytochrome c reductase iron-sulfur subunit [Caldilinea sp.]|jgi:cytochrome b6-f complex iron-sulfur subunit